LDDIVNKSREQNNKNQNMIKNKQTIFENLGELKIHCLEYKKYIVTERQVITIKEIYEELNKFNEIVFLNMHRFGIHPIELGTLIAYSFKLESLYELFDHYWGDFFDEFKNYESFKLKCETLVQINMQIVNRKRNVTHAFW
jgi:hypothetical protein